MSDTTAGLSKRALMSAGGALAVSLIPELQALAQSAKGQPRLLLDPMVGTPEPNQMTLGLGKRRPSGADRLRRQSGLCWF